MNHLERLMVHLGWADRKVQASLERANPLPPRMLELYAHVLGAEHIWYVRLVGRSPAVAVWPQLDLAECRRLADENLTRLQAFVAGLGPDDFQRGVTYKNSAGQEFTSTIEDILLHVALHGAYHRGQIAAGLRKAQQTPEPTDYIAWARGAPAATRTAAMGPLTRTPDERFVGLPDFPFAPHYLTVDRARIHYLDEGPRDGPIVLLLHGEPTWSFLYRRVIPLLVAAGCRVVAPDFLGFGRSDKLTNPADYSYALHVGILHRVVETLDLERVTLFGQDWGGLIGLRVVAEAPDRFAAVVAANTALPDGTLGMPPAFHKWRSYAASVPELRIGKIVRGGTVHGLTDEVAAAYDAPFPDEASKAGARIFPALVPIEPDDPAVPDNRRAWAALEQWTRPFLTAFSDGDPITAGAERFFQQRVPGARGRTHVTIRDAGHFLQEDQPEAVAAAILGVVPTGGRR